MQAIEESKAEQEPRTVIMLTPSNDRNRRARTLQRTMRVPRLFCLVAVVTTAACARDSRPPSATAPSATRSVSGTWAGSYVPVCPNSPNCASVVGAPNGPQGFRACASPGRQYAERADQFVGMAGAGRERDGHNRR